MSVHRTPLKQVLASHFGLGGSGGGVGKFPAPNPENHEGARVGFELKLPLIQAYLSIACTMGLFA